MVSHRDTSCKQLPDICVHELIKYGINYCFDPRYGFEIKTLGGCLKQLLDGWLYSEIVGL